MIASPLAQEGWLLFIQCQHEAGEARALLNEVLQSHGLDDWVSSGGDYKWEYEDEQVTEDEVDHRTMLMWAVVQAMILWGAEVEERASNERKARESRCELRGLRAELTKLLARHEKKGPAWADEED